MSSATDASHTYLKSAVLTAPPEQLQLMLFDGAIRFATRGREAIETRDREAAFTALDRAQQIVLELNNGINRDFQPDLADRVAAVYNFVYRRLVDANVGQDLAALDEALSILQHQRETWLMLIDKLRQEAGARASVNAPAAGDGPDRPSSFHAEG